jgi:hypothetical protein
MHASIARRTYGYRMRTKKSASWLTYTNQRARSYNRAMQI